MRDDEFKAESTLTSESTGTSESIGMWERWVTALVVTGASLFVLWQLQPDLIFSDTTPTGGDMGAHVWGPAYLRDELLPNLRLSGWTPDWYAGFPAFQFYMVLPALAIVILDVGIHPLISVPIVLSLLVASIATRLQATNPANVASSVALRRRAHMVLVALVVVTPLLLPLPYNVAFKVVAVSGVVLFPVAAWALGHLSGMRFPGPPILALGSLLFAFDRSFNIYGGNIASTLAGEFAASISLSLSLVAIGFAIKGTATNKQRNAAALFIALTGLCHLLPAFFVLAALFVIAVLRILEGRFTVVGWLAHVGVLAGLLSAFWVMPFALRTDYLNDMGWERINLVHSPLVTRSTLNPADVLSDYPPLPVLLIFAAIGVLLSIRHRLTLGYVLALTGVLMAAGFQWFPDGRLWNARILPFYYLCVALLAAIGVAYLIVEVARVGSRVRWAVIIVGVAALFVPVIRDAWVWPDPVAGEPYFEPVIRYVVRVLATAAIALCLPLEIFGQLSRFVHAKDLVAAALGTALLCVSPAREVRTNEFLTVGGVFWAVVLALSIGSIVLVVINAAEGVLALRNRHQIPTDDLSAGEPVKLGSASNELADGVEPGGTHESVATASTEPNAGAQQPRLTQLVAPVIASGFMFVLLGLALGVVGGTSSTDDGTAFSLPGIEIASKDSSFIPGWARWNFTGLQQKGGDEAGNGDVGQGGWLEYQYVQRTMAGVGQEHGCGRAMWEFAPELNRYGTTMAMMLLPLWTDGCIGSMEGLYFEATPTVPYHFLLQSDVSAPARTVGVSTSVGGPSRAMRDLPYGSFDIEVGVARMRELGVRYYMAFSPPSVAAAQDHPDLLEVASATPWTVFALSSPIVEGLSVQPVVIDGVRDHQDNWLDVGIDWFGDLEVPRPASSGPESWAALPASEIISRYEDRDTDVAGSVGTDSATLEELLPITTIDNPAVVTDVNVGTDRISFAVDQLGKPVLVRVSAFPNWTANGADGPFRVAPNFMVVVPTSNEVELVFARSGVDLLALGLTAMGLLLFVVGMRRRRSEIRVPGPLHESGILGPLTDDEVDVDTNKHGLPDDARELAEPVTV